MNDYFLTILIRERQHQLLMDARDTRRRPARRDEGLLNKAADLGVWIQTLFCGRCCADNIPVGGWGKEI